MPTMTFADRYQSVLVPVIFEPWARELIRRANPRPGETCLDLACGTGVVTRQVAQTVQTPGRLVGADHSADMLKVARNLAEDIGLEAEWVEADAADLPFDSGVFDLAFCQQALQFFPDRPAALRELHRVLKPGGRIAFCVQQALEVNPMLRAQAAALDAHIGPSAGDAVRAICSLPDGDILHQLFTETGFKTVQIDPVTLSLHHPDARTFAKGAMGGMHTGDKLAGLAPDAVDRAVEAFLQGLGDCLNGQAMTVPHRSNVITAQA